MITSILTVAVSDFTIVLFLMFFDLLTGVAKTLQKHSFKSAKLRNTLNKSVIYFIVLLIGGCLTVLGESGVAGIFVILISLVEGASILENLGELFPNSHIVKLLKKRLNNKLKEK